MSPLEKAEIEARAEEEGCELSEHIRQRSQAKRREAGPKPSLAAATANPVPPASRSFESRVAEKIRALRGLPARNAKALAIREVRREMAKEADQ